MRFAVDISQTVFDTGVSVYTKELVSRLPKDEVLKFGYSFGQFKKLTKEYPDAKIAPLPHKVMSSLWNDLHIIDPQLFIGRKDVIHCSDWLHIPTSAKTVSTVHDMSPFTHPNEMDREIVVNHKKRFKWMLKEVDHIICVSNATRDTMLNIYPEFKDRSSVIYESMPTSLELTPNPVRYKDYILCIGARQKRKNIEKFLQSHEKFFKSYSLPANIVIVGEYSQPFAKKNVQALGHVSDQTLVDLLASASAFVYPSLTEGFGLPLLSAMYYGCPIACSDIPVFKEIASSCATFFDPSSEEAIAAGISHAIQTRESLIRNAKIRINDFDWDKCAKQTINIYKSLC